MPPRPRPPKIATALGFVTRICCMLLHVFVHDVCYFILFHYSFDILAGSVTTIAIISAFGVFTLPAKLSESLTFPQIF